MSQAWNSRQSLNLCMSRSKVTMMYNTIPVCFLTEDSRLQATSQNSPLHGVTLPGCSQRTVQRSLTLHLLCYRSQQDSLLSVMLKAKLLLLVHEPKVKLMVNKECEEHTATSNLINILSRITATLHIVGNLFLLKLPLFIVYQHRKLTQCSQQTQYHACSGGDAAFVL